jgi:hypothetical protein
MWKKGWCRNPLLYSPQQSHLVGEDDLDCNRGMGSYWDPIEGDVPEVEPPLRFNPPPQRTIAPASPAVGTTAPRRPTPEPIVVRQPGADPVTRPHARRSATAAPPPAAIPEGYSAPQEPYSWGEYLRRSYPVIGVILLLGAFWVWSARQLSGTTAPTPTMPVSAPTVAAPSGTVAVITPTAGAAGPAAAPAASALPVPPPGVIAPGARVVISTSGAGANIRQSPTTTAPIVTSQDDGTPLTITGASKDADGFTWWPVQGDGFSGWVAGALIDLAP